MSVDEIFEEFTEKEEPSKVEKPEETKKEEPKPKVAEKPETTEDDFFGEGVEETKEETEGAPPIEVKKEEAKEEPTEKPKEKPTEPKKETPEEKDEFFEEEAKAEEKPLETTKAESKDFFGEEVTTEEAPSITEKPKLQETAKFLIVEAEGTGKIVFMIYGLKGEGKTDLSFSFPGKIACLSFDRKSLPIKKGRYENDDRIKVFDAILHLDKSSPENYLESCDKTFRYVNAILDHVEKDFKPDWIIVDASDVFSKICEMTMRYRNSLMPFQGIANRNLWKERNLYVDQIHNKSSKIANKGVIYTAYTDSYEVVKEGEFLIKEDIPKWFGDIMMETDVVIRVVAPFEKTGKRFYAIVQSSKSKLIPTGLKKDITDVGIKALIQKEG